MNNNIKMQTCWELITDGTIHPYTANVSMGVVVFNLHEDDFNHIFEHQEIIRNIITPKYQIMFNDFGKNMKSVVIALSRNIL